MKECSLREIPQTLTGLRKEGFAKLWRFQNVIHRTSEGLNEIDVDFDNDAVHDSFLLVSFPTILTIPEIGLDASVKIEVFSDFVSPSCKCLARLKLRLVWNLQILLDLFSRCL